MYVVLGFLQAFISLGALAGGFMLVKDPSGVALGLPVSMLEGSAFSDFLVPGLFLFLVHGVGSLAGAVLSFRKNRNAAPAAIALGGILVAWILIQISIIRSFHWLHALYLACGLIELLLGLLLRQPQRKLA